MSLKQSFRPTGEATVNIDALVATSARVALTTGAQQRIMNNGTATVWIAFGDATVVATVAAGIPFAPGATEVLTPPVGATYVAMIAAAATGKIYFTPGAGI